MNCRFFGHRDAGLPKIPSLRSLRGRRASGVFKKTLTDGGGHATIASVKKDEKKRRVTPCGIKRSFPSFYTCFWI